MKRATTPRTEGGSFFMKSGWVEKLISVGVFQKKFLMLVGDKLYVHKKQCDVQNAAKKAEQIIPLPGVSDFTTALKKDGGRSYFFISGFLFALPSVAEIGPWVEIITKALEDANRNSAELMMRAMAVVISSPFFSSSTNKQQREDLRNISKVCRPWRALASTNGVWSPISNVRLPARLPKESNSLISHGLQVSHASEPLILNHYGSIISTLQDDNSLEKALRPMLSLKTAFKEVKKISLGNHSITDTSLSMLLILLPNLELLNIEGINVTDSGIEDISSGRHGGSNIKFVSFYHCPRITLETALTNLSHLPKLESVLFIMCETEDGNDDSTKKYTLPKTVGEWSRCKTCGQYFRETLNNEQSCIFHSFLPVKGLYNCCGGGIPPSVCSPGCKQAKHVKMSDADKEPDVIMKVYDCPAESLRWVFPINKKGNDGPKEIQLENLWLRRSVLPKNSHASASTCRCLRKRAEDKK